MASVLRKPSISPRAVAAMGVLTAFALGFGDCLPHPVQAADSGFYEVVLEKAASSKAPAVRALKLALKLTDSEAEKLVDDAPSVIKTGLSKKDAEAMKLNLYRALGAGRIRDRVVFKVRPVGAADTTNLQNP